MAATVVTEVSSNLIAVGGTDGIITIPNTALFNYAGAIGSITRIDGSQPATFAIIEALDANRLRANVILPGDAPPGAQDNFSSYGIGSAIHLESQVLQGSTNPTATADWDPSLVRYFVVNPRTGIDTNRGYEDLAAGSLLTAAPAAPLKTHAGLLAKLPRNGAGRSVVVLYVNSDHTNGTVFDAIDWSGISGYKYIRKTGSTDGSNSLLDARLAGAMRAVSGPNVDGSWTVGSATATLLTISAGSLPAEVNQGGITGLRIRFTGDVTPALANIMAYVLKNDTTTITPGVNFSGSGPAAGNTFFIEIPGVLTPSYHEVDFCTSMQTQPPALSAYLTPATVGINVTGTLPNGFKIGNSGTTTYSFCNQASTSNNIASTRGAEAGNILISRLYIREGSASSMDLGFGFRTTGRTFLAANQMAINSYASLVLENADSNSGATEFNAVGLSITSNFFARGVRIRQVSQSATNIGSCIIGSAGATGVQRLRMLDRGMTIHGTQINVWGIQGEACGSAVLQIGAYATSALTVTGCFAEIDDVVNGPSGGNTSSGMKVSNNRLGGIIRVGLRAACTASGTAGEVVVASGIDTGGGLDHGDSGLVTTWADLANKTNVPDFNGTNLIGAVGSKIAVGSCHVVTNKNGTALAVGDIVRGNGTTGQVVKAVASSLPAQHEVLGVMVTPAADNALGLMFVSGGTPYVLTDAAPAAAKTLYLSTGTAGQGTTTVPASGGTNRKLRLGGVVDVLGSPNACYASWTPECVSVAADDAR